MRLSISRGVVLSSGVLAFTIACSGAAPASSSLPTVPPLPSIALPSIALPSMALPSIDVNVPPDESLEGMFPDSVGGHPLDPQSASGEGIRVLFPGSDPADLDNFLSGLGANIDQVSAAMSFNLWQDPNDANVITGLTLAALRVQGVDNAQIVAGFAELVRDSVPNAEIQTATIGGKSVTAVANPEDAEDNVYLYGIGDIVFMGGGTAAHVEEAFSKLP